MGLAEWLFNKLDQLPPAQQSGVLQYRLSPVTADPDRSDLTRIFYLPGTAMRNRFSTPSGHPPRCGTPGTQTSRA